MLKERILICGLIRFCHLCQCIILVLVSLGEVWNSHPYSSQVQAREAPKGDSPLDREREDITSQAPRVEMVWGYMF